jgi:hypothetical protein
VRSAERSARPYSPCDVDTAEICDIGDHGISEGEAIAEAFSEIRKSREEILGTTSVVERVLCEHGRTDGGADQSICKTPREDGQADRRTAKRLIQVKR